MSKIPFQVSARTARLIGRENIASSKGAIIELVKNGYDADSRVSIVYFDNQYTTVQQTIAPDYLEQLISKGIATELLNDLYEKNDEEYTLKDNPDETKLLSLKGGLKKLNTLYIIDAGEGMTQNIIRNYWMTIGTDNKAVDIFTRSGRIKAGAKGIGRFALDKLGSQCEMITVFDPAKHEPDSDVKGKPTTNTGYLWKVNWEDFEGEFKTIDEVKADLTGLHANSLKEEIEKSVEGLDLSKIPEETFQYGTILKITDLREDWEDFYVNEVFSDLEVVVPPRETAQLFRIYLFSSLHTNKYGEVLGSVCDDYDFKLVATADDNQNVHITVQRNEYDLEAIDPNLFNREAFKNWPYTKEDFKKGYWEKDTTFSKLLPGFSQIDDDKTLEKIGRFSFTFYFMKRTYSNPDAEKFNYRKFASNDRKFWLNKYGGIKLFRDNFRVRPYGETNSSSFDWLGLGSRKAKSPAAVSKPEGGYKVEPENVAGAIIISRIANINFDDKSSREGLQENQEFQIFKQLITAIVGEFEEDRSYIASEMLKFWEDKFRADINRREAEKLAKAILARAATKREEGTEEESDKELFILAELNKEKTELIEKLEDEQKILRGLASTGIVLASFSHDLSKLNSILDSRTDKVRKLISEKITESDYANVEERENPFAQLEKIRKQDIKLQNWLNFSLGVTRKDKRTRKQLFFKTYFSNFKTDWSTVLDNRGITLDTSGVDSVDMRVFEIDIDSIFNNLLVNSIDAFKISKVNRPRVITINVFNTDRETVMEYYDSGPGLSSDIEKPDKIFDALYTTKRNKHTGEEEGTGLGMWILKSVVQENDGQVKLLFPEEGFGIRMNFPIKYKSA